MNATMALSKKQALAVAKSVGVEFPEANNGWVKVGNAILRRLPLAFRKHKVNAQAYRLSAKDHADLSQYHRIVDENGKSVCIVWRDED